jgi:hypothetical protein
MIRKTQVNEQAKKNEDLTNVIRTLLSVPQEEITCDECYDVIDQYVDMLRAGDDPVVVLPKVKEHLGQCECCDVEFRALISILEAAAASLPSDTAA